MRAVIHALVGMLLLAVAVLLLGVLYARSTGLRAQPEPGPLETRLARSFRALAVPSDVRAMTNPLGTSEDVFRPGMEHFARYCAVCHANDGSGKDTPFGKGLFPKPPDLRGESQNLTDGEIFYVIENGIRFSGMPAFGTGSADPAGEKLAWQLVSFIRHLPRITPDEVAAMEALNPL